MPKVRRQRHSEALYHVMSHSISEIDLFQSDEDRAYYLSLVKRYIEEFHCKVYAYILMNTHMHLYINPCGYDISSFMHSLNSAYVNYYNKRYERRGHLFQDRFASKIVDNNTYSITLSAYIHNNAKDLPGFAGREETYRYSSYGIYTGHRKDAEGIVDTGFLLSLFDRARKKAQEKYRSFTVSMRETGIMKEVDDNIMRAYTENEYRSEKRQVVRYNAPEELIRKIGEHLGERVPERLRTKYSRETSGYRAFTAYVMRVLCGYTYRKICEYIGNMSMSGVSRLSNKGFKLLNGQACYRDAFNSLIYTG